MSDDVLELVLQRLAEAIGKLADAFEETNTPVSEQVGAEIRMILEWLEARRRSPYREK